jgi:hypothetical protein
MPILKNPRHEEFCRALAAGKSASAAYQSAGFAPSYANSSRLQRRDHIRQRVNEVVDQRQRAADRALASAAERVGIDQEWVLRNLKLNALMSMRAGDRSAAARSLELLGRHVGLFIDKKQVEINVIDDSDEYLVKLMKLVGTEAIDNEPAPLVIDHEPPEP